MKMARFTRISPASCRYPSYQQFIYHLHQQLSKNDIDVIKTSAHEVRDQKRVLLSKEHGGLIYPGKLCSADATPKNYYLVSQYDPEKVVGRANIYLIIDVLTSLIFGASMSFEDNSNAVVQNLLLSLKREQRNLLLKETEFTLYLVISGLQMYFQSKLKLTKAVDFTSRETMWCLKELGITVKPVPAASRSLKGTVEKTFCQFNIAHKEEFLHASLIKKRYDSDYKEMSCISIFGMRKLKQHYGKEGKNYPDLE